jgi:16S rRNA (guanine527-N7)-methyltransferase
MKDDFEILLARLPAEYGVILDAAAVVRLKNFLHLLVRWNERVRLIGSTSPDVLVLRHVCESLFLAKLVPLERQRLIDVGSGAGFPGFALQLAFPQLTTTLVEVNAKKAAFLKEAVRQAGLGRVVQSRSEELNQQAEIVTGRALEHMASGPAWAENLVSEDGVLACWVSLETASTWTKSSTVWQWREPVLIPNTHSRAILIGSKKK